MVTIVILRPKLCGDFEIACATVTSIANRPIDPTDSCGHVAAHFAQKSFAKQGEIPALYIWTVVWEDPSLGGFIDGSHLDRRLLLFEFGFLPPGTCLHLPSRLTTYLPEYFVTPPVARIPHLYIWLSPGPEPQDSEECRVSAYQIRHKAGRRSRAR